MNYIILLLIKYNILKNNKDNIKFDVSINYDEFHSIICSTYYIKGIKISKVYLQNSKILTDNIKLFYAKQNKKSDISSLKENANLKGNTL